MWPRTGFCETFRYGRIYGMVAALAAVSEVWIFGNALKGFKVGIWGRG